LSSVLCGLAWSAGSLIGFRVLQGLSGGLLAPMMQMMIARVAGRHMARVIGYSALPILLAPLLGPVIAGAILQYASWRWLFLVNLPVGILAIVLAVRLLPSDSHDVRPRDLDWIGLLLLSPGLVLLLYGLERLAQGTGRAAFTAALPLLALFLWTARKKGSAALIDLRLFRSKAFSAAAIVQFLSNGVVFSGQMLIPVFLIQGCGRSAGEMGWLLAPIGLGMMITYPFLGVLTNRLGTRYISAGGAFLAFLASLPFPYMALRGLDIRLFTAALFFRGMGQGAVGVPSISAAYASVDPRDLPMATTSLNIVQRLGGPTFITICAAVLTWRLHSDAPHPKVTAYAWAFALLCGLHAFTFLAACRLPLRIAAPAGATPSAGPE
jgi:MFS family permease